MKTIVFILIALFVSACNSQIQFSEPQPTKTPNIAAFSNELIGTYVSLDSNVIIINPTCLISSRIESLNDTISNNSLNATIKIDNQLNASKISSTITITKLTDTIATLNQNSVLRKLSGKYFLNIASNYGYKIYGLDFKNDQLILSQITEKDKTILDALVSETKNMEDSVVVYTPTFSEFKAYIKHKESMENQEVFQKIKIQ